jgi:hypothetical protein
MMGSEQFHGVRRTWIVVRLEPASFEVEHFALGRDACLEVHGRWFGVRGRRFMRPTLTAVADGREHRLLAVLDHKPWIAEEGEAWLAAFPWSADAAALLDAELTVAPDVTVPLPAPSVSPGARRARAAAPRARRAQAPSEAEKPKGRSKDERGDEQSRMRVERDAALRTRDEALSELAGVRGERERLHHELKRALSARESALAERHDVVESEVELRIADLRAEVERERAAAGQAAQIARERDAARLERVEAIRERDEAHAERDSTRQERNRMLAQRDTTRTRAEAAVRKWEATAALGTRRTQERDAAVSERDRLARERDAALEERNRLAGERDIALAARDRAAGERDAILARREEAAGEQTLVLPERAASRLEQETAAVHIDPGGLAGGRPGGESPEVVPTESTARTPGDRSRPGTPTFTGTHKPRRPPPPPGSAETQPGVTRARGGSSSTVQPRARGDEAAIWRARLIAVAALLVVLIVLVVTLTAK